MIFFLYFEISQSLSFLCPKKGIFNHIILEEAFSNISIGSLSHTNSAWLPCLRIGLTPILELRFSYSSCLYVYIFEVLKWIIQFCFYKPISYQIWIIESQGLSLISCILWNIWKIVDLFHRINNIPMPNIVD